MRNCTEGRNTLIIYRGSHTEKEKKLYQLSKRILIKLIVEARLSYMSLEEARCTTFNDWAKLNNETHDFECIVVGLISILEGINSGGNHGAIDKEI